MPNWCATNYVIRGSEENLNDLVHRLNTMENHSNGFGRYWMGNLLINFGIPYEQVISTCNIHCRGIFSPQADEEACLCGPDVDETQVFEISEDGLLRMSTITAWGQSDSMEDFLKEKYPSLEFFFFSTDEFGNFHYVHDPEDIGNFYHFHLDSDDESTWYYSSQFEEFLNDLKSACPGLDVPDSQEKLLSDKFIENFLEWRDADESREFTGFFVAEKI